MSIFKKIRDEITGKELMKDLCEHLKQIGINATLLDSESSEAIGPRWKKGPFVSEFVYGNIKIEDKNIDLLQVGRGSEGGGVDGEGGGQVDRYFYVVRASVEGFERSLKVKCKPIKKGVFSREVIGFQWEGGELAQELNADSDLKAMILLSGLFEIVIELDKNNQCVRILGYSGFPNREEFEIYDRIAYNIRGTISQLMHDS